MGFTSYKGHRAYWTPDLNWICKRKCCKYLDWCCFYIVKALTKICIRQNWNLPKPTILTLLLLKPKLDFDRPLNYFISIVCWCSVTVSWRCVREYVGCWYCSEYRQCTVDGGRGRADGDGSRPGGWMDARQKCPRWKRVCADGIRPVQLCKLVWSSDLFVSLFWRAWVRFCPEYPAFFC